MDHHSPEGITAIKDARTTWTAQQDDLIIKLWGEGKSASKIAERFPGKSRNAVLGRAHRLRAAGATVPLRPTQPKKARQPRPRLRIVRNEPFIAPKPLPAIVDTLEGSVTLLELTGCKWPVTESAPHRFCNREPMENKPYCEGHAARATEPKRSRPVKTTSSGSSNPLASRGQRRH